MLTMNPLKTTRTQEDTHSPIEGKHNQGIASDAQCPDDKDEYCDNIVSMVRHIHLVEEAALGVSFLWLHALSGPHGSNTSSGLSTWQDAVGSSVCNPLLFACAWPP